MSLKALQAQCALAGDNIDFRKVRGAKLHISEEVSGAILCTETQMQAYHWAVIHKHKNDGFEPIRADKKTDD